MKWSEVSLTVLAARQHIHEGCLPGSAGAHQGGQDARLKGSGDSLQQLQLPWPTRFCLRVPMGASVASSAMGSENAHLCPVDAVAVLSDMKVCMQL